MSESTGTILGAIHAARCSHQPIQKTIARVNELDQKAIDDWRAENRSSAVFGSNSSELEDLSKMFDD